MTEERVTPLRQRMIEDMNIRGLGEKTQKAHALNRFAIGALVAVVALKWDMFRRL